MTANLKYTIVKNEMATEETDAPYLGKIIAAGVRNRVQLTADILESEHFASATLDAVIDAMVAETQELCRLGKDVDWGPVKFLTKMHGSEPYEDSAFADSDNAAISVDGESTTDTRNSFSAIEPEKISLAALEDAITVSNIMDVATEEFGVIIGTTQAKILGNGITLDGEGEYAKALNAKTGELAGTATVVSVERGQRATITFNPQLAAGKYYLVVATKGLAEEENPRLFKKSFEAIYVTPPAVTIKFHEVAGGPAVSEMSADTGNLFITRLDGGEVPTTALTATLTPTGGGTPVVKSNVAVQTDDGGNRYIANPFGEAAYESVTGSVTIANSAITGTINFVAA